MANLLFFQCFDECKKIMLNRGHVFLKKLDEARGKIVKLAANFIEDGTVSKYPTFFINNLTIINFQKILTHSRSRVVLQTLRKSYKQNKSFEVFVAISAPDNSG